MRELQLTMEDWDEAVVVALGSSLAGEYATPEDLLEAALRALPEHGLTFAAQSRWWKSSAWPDSNQPRFVNGVAMVKTELAPRQTLDALLAVEQAFGRRRGTPNAPRTLDLDLIAHGRAVLDAPELAVPHPRAHRRRFVMGPLAEIAPGWRHPVLGRTAAELLLDASEGGDARPL